MKCPNCGNEAQADAVFCDQCGARLQPAAAAPAPAPVASVPPAPIQESAAQQPTPAPQPAAAPVAAPQGIVCPSCGAPATPGEMFCAECGTRLAAPAPESAASVAAVVPAPAPTGLPGTCPDCGAKVNPGDEFCYACGADLRNRAAAAPSATPVEAAPAVSTAPAPQPVQSVAPAQPEPAPVAQPVVQPQVATPAPQPAPVAAPAMVCPSCGAPIGPADTFCGHCGAALTGAAATVAAAPAPQPVAQPVASPAPQPAMAAGGPRLVVAASGIELPLVPGRETLVGREDPYSGVVPDVDLSPHGGEDAGVSRRHFKISLVGGQYTIEDLNSTNYTLLNRQRLMPGQPAVLANGDEIRAGKLKLIFRVS